MNVVIIFCRARPLLVITYQGTLVSLSIVHLPAPLIPLRIYVWTRLHLIHQCVMSPNHNNASPRVSHVAPIVVIIDIACHLADYPLESLVAVRLHSAFAYHHGSFPFVYRLSCGLGLPCLNRLAFAPA